MLEDHYPDFTGKHVHVYLAYKHVVSYLVQEATFEMQAGRLFLVGRVSDAYDDDIFGRGRAVCIAWDLIEQYILFDSAEQWRKEVGMSRARKERRYAESQQKRRAEK